MSEKLNLMQSSNCMRQLLDCNERNFIQLYQKHTLNRRVQNQCLSKP